MRPFARCVAFFLACIMVISVVGCMSADTKARVDRVAQVQAKVVGFIAAQAATDTDLTTNGEDMCDLWNSLDGPWLGVPEEAKAIIKANVAISNDFIATIGQKTRADLEDQARRNADALARVNTLLNPKKEASP
jgi:hypothetical protein